MGRLRRSRILAQRKEQLYQDLPEGGASGDPADGAGEAQPAWLPVRCAVTCVRAASGVGHHDTRDLLNK